MLSSPARIICAGKREWNRKWLFKLRTGTTCAPLCWHMDGDPFSPSQRLVLVFVTLASSLFFNVLFFVRPVPLCVPGTGSIDPTIQAFYATPGMPDANGETCLAFVCPSCNMLHGGACTDLLLNPDEVCRSWKQPAGSNFTAHDACLHRPLELCRIEAGSEVSYTEQRRGFCTAGAPHTFEPSYGHELSSCSVFEKPTIPQLILKAVLAAGCTMPFVVLLQKMFESLRKPFIKAVVGERVKVKRKSKASNACECCSRCAKVSFPHLWVVRLPPQPNISMLSPLGGRVKGILHGDAGSAGSGSASSATRGVADHEEARQQRPGQLGPGKKGKGKKAGTVHLPPAKIREERPGDLVRMHTPTRIRMHKICPNL